MFTFASIALKRIASASALFCLHLKAGGHLHVYCESLKYPNDYDHTSSIQILCQHYTKDGLVWFRNLKAKLELPVKPVIAWTCSLIFMPRIKTYRLPS